MRRAFTLIELLVVIAIIAILAAILFPVFASAKEAARKTVAISNTKQVATGLMLYGADYDDCMPLSHRVISGFLYPAIMTPNRWCPAYAVREDDSLWANTLIPYTKNYQIFTYQGQNVYDPWGCGVTTAAPQNQSLSYNGLLNGFNLSGVAAPSKLTLVWPGNMKEEIYGGNFTNPMLLCRAGTGTTALRDDCRFNPTGGPDGTQTTAGPGTQVDISWYTYSSANDTAWVVSRGMVFVATDTSARWRPLNLSGTVTSGSDMVRDYNDPTMRYAANARMSAFHRCQTTPTSPLYLSFFRPDSEFNYQFGNTAGTRCTP
jgi:prepilin-type N-terminal cleavage/methylation domain-containing protein